MCKRLIILGGGPAGCAAALSAAQAGFSVTLYEQNALGGVCLHSGCMPTKALLHAPSDVNWPAYTAQTCSKIDVLRAGMERRLRRAGVVICPQRLELSQLPTADAVILATGRPNASLPELSGKYLYTPETILHLQKLPAEIAIYGGGVTGMEYAQIFAAMGVRVAVYEKAPLILPKLDLHYVERLEERCCEMGIEFFCGKALSLEKLPQKQIFLATGRSGLSTDDCARLAACGIAADSNGIIVDAVGQTSCPGIYAAGDCTNTTATAYEAATAGRRIVDALLGQPATRPETKLQIVCGAYDLVGIGSTTGLSEEAELEYNGYAFLRDCTSGAVRLFCDCDTGRLTGAQMFYPGAAEDAGFLAAAIDAGMPVAALAQGLWFHPAYTETLQEAAIKLYALFRNRSDRRCI